MALREKLFGIFVPEYLGRQIWKTNNLGGKMHVEPVTLKSDVPDASGDETNKSCDEVPVGLFTRGSGVIEDGIERCGTIFNNSLINF